MKTTKTLISAITGMALFAGAVHAQFKVTGTDGITASPKLREMINSHAVSPAEPADSARHPCAMCKDQYTTRVDYSAKGVIRPTVLIAKDLCPGCETKVSTERQGKRARN